ncbi:MAG: ribosome maturation factor RimP [Ruminococcus sp.]|nr:ribosome maturation factor RimP [Ruminococcus sp.]
MNTVERARVLAEPLCDEMGLYLWDVRFEKEGALWYLRIFIDRDEGIDMNTCESFSQRYNELLDREDFISQQYIFEAGSPGLGRKLTRREHFDACSGDEVRVKLYKAKDGVKSFVGLLKNPDDEGFELITKTDDEGNPTERFRFLYKECSAVNLNDDTDLF